MSNVLMLQKNTKTCRHCKLELELSMFSKCTASKDGLQSVCRKCDNKRLKQARIARGDEWKKYSKEYRDKKRYDFEWRIQGLLNASRQRSVLKGRENTLTREDLIAAYPKDNKCPVFGFILEWNKSGFRETSPSIDRIDSAKGYTKENIQIISWKANRIKSYATAEELEIVLNYMKLGG